MKPKCKKNPTHLLFLLFSQVKRGWIYKGKKHPIKSKVKALDFIDSSSKSKIIVGKGWL